ncbi:hypothetical protein HYFRA_00014003 [Hymenoscyphus fraxineus]|uniref:Uncharacterized protein n=1 Tax=Hymenoscyphus fraxineus TaxID=746836 RepID=A0A9N9LE73_9HELO|nr:hypothetical protein HYFRA_00014003 [Hymenoscyphus fraxineus]
MVTFNPNRTFSEGNSSELKATWASLVPLGRGFIGLDSHGNPRPWRGMEAEIADMRVVTVYHQLHCLDGLRMASMGENHTEHNNLVGQTPEEHLQHCFDYIRQSLLCNADTTLEPLTGFPPDVQGWGTSHQCRSHQEIFDWTYKHRATDEGGIV